MRLLHVVASYAPAWRYGGPVQSVSSLCRGLARLGEDVTVFTTNIDGAHDLPVPAGQRLMRDGVKVYYFQVGLPRRWSFSWALTRALEREVQQFDLVHLHAVFVYPTLAGGIFCRQAGVPYVLSPRGMLCGTAYGMKWFRKKLYLKLVECKNLEGAQAIHFTSQEEFRRTISLDFRCPAVVVPNGVDLEEFDRLPERGAFHPRYPELAEKRVILFLGRLHAIKGLDRLVVAFARVGRQMADAHLVIAGYDSDGYGMRVRRWLLEQGMADRVTFTGPLAGAHKLAALRDSALLVLPSYQENFGMAALEAMAAGLPVVVSKGVALAEDIEQAGAGLVVEGDPAGLAAAVLQLLEDRSLRARMGEAGRRLARETFSAERVAERMRTVYRSIVSRKLN